MQRRTALRGLAMSLGGLVALPAWATNWTPESLGTSLSASADDEALLGDIVDTIIPETTVAGASTPGASTPGASTPGASTPGAKSLNVHRFVMRMIRDCYGEPAQTALKQGLALTESTAQQLVAKPFANCDASQRKSILTAVAASTDPAGKAFVNLIKRLTIQGYTSSEYYMVTVQKFNMAPGYYHGCVPIEKLTSAGGR